MGQIRRIHTGSITIPAKVLTDLDTFFAMDTASPREEVVAAVEKIKQQEGRDFELFNFADLGERYHEWLYLNEVHHLQSLRENTTTRLGMVTVDARTLSMARNYLDDASQRVNGSCEEWLEELDEEISGAERSTPTEKWDPAAYAASLRAERANVGRIFDETQSCGRCDLCRASGFCAYLDWLFTNAGFATPAYCETTEDDVRFWLEVVNAPAA